MVSSSITLLLLQHLLTIYCTFAELNRYSESPFIYLFFNRRYFFTIKKILFI